MQISIRLPEDLQAKIDALVTEDLTRATVIRMALRRGLEGFAAPAVQDPDAPLTSTERAAIAPKRRQPPVEVRKALEATGATPSKTPCDHPKESWEHLSWGTVCGLCKQKMR